MGSPDLTGTNCTTLYHFVPLCTTLYNFVPLCTTLYHFVPLCTTLYNLVPLCSIWYHWKSVEFTGTHWISLRLPSASQGKRESLPGSKGKRERRTPAEAKREKGKVGQDVLAAFPPYNQTARTHARTNETKRNDFPVGLTPPNLRCVFEVFVTDAAHDGTIFEFGQTPIPSRPGTR